MWCANDQDLTSEERKASLPITGWTICVPFSFRLEDENTHTAAVQMLTGQIKFVAMKGNEMLTEFCETRKDAICAARKLEEPPL